jgi:Abnormal spindle-like microcephaly-assoc'd, ASPM-SPD-2-Hydin/Beta-propeller repeat/Lactonase, 7-bladed beta-propeller
MSFRALRFISSAFIFLTALSAIASAASRSNISLPLTFEENKGQAPQQYLFLSRHNQIEAMFLPNGVDFSLPQTKNRSQRLGLRLVGSNAETRIRSFEQTEGRSNYLLGSDPSRWIQGVPNYSRLKYEGVYPDIDLVFYGNLDKLEHDFQLAAGADPSRIAFEFEGVRKASLSNKGDLQLHLDEGVLVLDKPVAYQMTSIGRNVVDAAYVIGRNGAIQFKIGRYDHTLPLVIDPALSYSTYLDKLSLGVTAIAVDGAGSTYIAGYTFSSSYPATSGAFQSVCTACPNAPTVFITKLNSAGTAEVYSTFIGGSSYSQPFGMAVDANGNAVVVGYTQSTDFPVKNPIGSGTVSNGTQFGFISSLSPDGSTLNYSSLLGGGSQPFQSSTTIANAVAVDASGSAYITGTTDSPVFPTTPGALNSGTPQYPASIAFVSKFVPTGTLAYSALIGNVEPQNGGAGLIGVEAIAVDPQGSAYITGGAGTLWPTTANAYATQIPGSTPFRGVFVTKLSLDASSLSYSTFLGAGGGTGIVLDSNLDAIVTGGADTPTFPVTSNAYLPTMKDCCAFLSKVSPDGSQLLYSTFLGSATGSGNISAMGLGLDPNGNIWVSGSTTDSRYPMLKPLQSVFPSSSLPPNTGFVSEFDPSGTMLEFSSFFGGLSPGVKAIALDSTGKAHIAGTTVSGTYTTPGAFLGTVTPPPQSVQYTYGYAALIDPAKDSPAGCFSQSTLSFGFVPVQKSATRTLTITNCGTSDLSISSIQSSDPTFSAPANTNNCGSAIVPNSSCTVGIAFTPTSAINYSATLTFTSNASIPTVSLLASGTGAVPVATITNRSLSFSPLLVSQASRSQSIVIQNSGHDTLILNLAQTTITGDFAYSGTGCSSPLLPGNACLLMVSFGPTQAGAETGVLTVATNDPVNPTITVSLSGTGVASYPVPTITSFDQPTIPIGTSAVSIEVFGTNFFPASVVRVNGQAQQTTYANGTMLRAVIDPALRTNLGELSVTVFNPVPGGGESSASKLTLYQTLLINPSFIAAVPGSNLLYAAIPASSGTNPNTVIPVDPTTGTLGTPISVGKDPRLLAASSDGKYLFVANYGDQTVQRINLQTSTVERTFSFIRNPSCPSCGPLATDLQPVPGTPSEVLLAQGSVLSLYNDTGLVNSVPTTTIPFSPTFNSIAFAGGSSSIYALPFTLVQNSFFTQAALDGAGLHYTPITGTNFGGNNTTGNEVVSDGTLLYTSAGQIWNPATQTEVGTFPVTTYYSNYRNVALDPSLGEIYVVGLQAYGSSSSAVVLSVYGMKSLGLTGTLAFPLIGYPDVTNLVRWGSNGFAFIAAGPGLTDQELYLGRSSIIAPQTVNAVPTLAGLSPSSATAGGGAFTLTLNGSNFLAGSTVSWNGSMLPVTYVSGTQLTASVPATDLAQSGTAQIAVTNPEPGGGTSSTQVFTIMAAIPQFASSASSVNFGNIAQGASSSAQAITLTNTGTAVLSISAIAASGDFSQTNTCAGTLAVNATCQVSIVFTPTAIGQRTGTLTVSDNATGSPQTVTLSGTGVQPLTLGVGTGGSTTATVASGQTATYNLSLSGSAGFSGTVALTCSGAPQNATCSIVPSTVTLPGGGSANFAVTVSTSAQTAYLEARSDTIVAGLGLFSLFTAPIFLLIRKRLPTRKWTSSQIQMLWVSALLITLAACSGGSKGSSQPVSPEVTPPGTYALTVTAAAGNTTVSQKLTLVVQ